MDLKHAKKIRQKEYIKRHSELTALEHQHKSVNVPHNRPMKHKLRWLLKYHPDIYSKFFSKQYSGVLHYEDYKENLWIYACLHIIEKAADKPSLHIRTGLEASGLFQKYGCSHFFVSSSITKAIDNTELEHNQVIDPMSIKLPYEAFVLIFPKNQSPFKSINVTRTSRKLDIYATHRHPNFKDEESFAGAKQFKICELTNPQQIATDWLVKVLYLMASRPKLTQTSSKRIVGKKKHKTWVSPVILGEKYHYKTENVTDANKRSTRTIHWRRGHFRHQPYGRMDLENRPSKVIWIEPMLVGSHE